MFQRTIWEIIQSGKEKSIIQSGKEKRYMALNHKIDKLQTALLQKIIPISPTCWHWSISFSSFASFSSSSYSSSISSSSCIIFCLKVTQVNVNVQEKGKLRQGNHLNPLFIKFLCLQKLFLQGTISWTSGGRFFTPWYCWGRRKV